MPNPVGLQAYGLTHLDRFPIEDRRLRRALGQLGILLQEPSGLTLTFAGISVKTQDPIFVDANGVGLNFGNGLELDPPDLVVKVQDPIFVDASGIGLLYDATYLAVVASELTFANPITGVITTTQNIVLDSDSAKLVLGDGQDMSIYYNGTIGVIDTSLVAASDLNIACGTEKTVVLTAPVYKDLYTAVDPARVSGTTNVIMVGNIREIVFSNGDSADFPSVELQHDYKEGTGLDVHLHIATRGTNASAYHVRYTLEYSLAPVNGVFGATTTLDVETTIAGGTAALTHKYIDLGDISGSGLTLGTQVKFVLKKITAASSDGPAANNPYVLQVGIHYQIDTVGSRHETSK